MIFIIYSYFCIILVKDDLIVHQLVLRELFKTGWNAIFDKKHELYNDYNTSVNTTNIKVMENIQHILSTKILHAKCLGSAFKDYINDNFSRYSKRKMTGDASNTTLREKIKHF